MKKALLGHNLQELKYIVSLFGLPSFTAKQIADWLYKKRVKSIDDMTNLSKSAREKLSAEYEVGRTEYSGKIISSDGTKKYLFMVGDRGVETVMIPDDDRYTICVSSQVGCKMGCKFCMTGRQGFHGHLSAAQILSQFLEIDESDKLTNAVFMGMGEPLDNYNAVLRTIEILTSEWGFGWSPKRITLSTIGVNSSKDGGVSPLKRFLDECTCHLAVSLHNPFSQERNELMPMEKPFPIEKTRMLRGLECRMNLIRFHKIPDSDLTPSPIPVIEAFKSRLNDAGLLTTLRASRGEDILAACGMLSGKKK